MPVHALTAALGAVKMKRVLWSEDHVALSGSVNLGLADARRIWCIFRLGKDHSVFQSDPFGLDLLQCPAQNPDLKPACCCICIVRGSWVLHGFWNGRSCRCDGQVSSRLWLFIYIYKVSAVYGKHFIYQDKRK